MTRWKRIVSVIAVCLLLACSSFVTSGVRADVIPYPRATKRQPPSTPAPVPPSDEVTLAIEIFMQMFLMR